MKSISKLFAGALAFGLIGTAAAQTTITITGSTAYRSLTHAAILNALSGEVYAYTGTDLGGAGQAIFSGNLGSQPVIIKTAWSGSITGILAVRTVRR